jgi:hypothetical protein
MDEIQASLALDAPSAINPESTVEFIFTYTNRNSAATHCLEKLTIAPT